MATSATHPTLSDWSKRLDPEGKIDSIVELLSETNEVLEDMVWVEGNLPTGHKTTIRSGLPSATWRLLNYGVQPDKSTTVQVTDTVGMLEAYAEVDKSLADLNGNTAAFRLSEDRAFLEAMNQEFADTLFYGSTLTDPEKFMGLSPRYNSLSASTASNIIDGGGGSDGDNYSIWLVVWGPNTVHGIFPKGSMAGLHHKDLGEVTLDDTASPAGKYQGYRTHYKWDCGLTVRDWRYIVRISDIDAGDLVADASAGAELSDLMVQALEQVQGLTMGRPVFYMHRALKSMLRRQIVSKTNVNLVFDNVAGKHVLSFDGVPVKRCDALLATEDQVPA